MKTMTAILCFLLALTAITMAACSKPKAEEPTPDVTVLAKDMLDNLNQIDAVMAEKITASANKFGTEDEIRKLLAEALQAHPIVLTSCYVDTKGILKYLEPAHYQDSEGVDISKQAHTIAMLENPAPTFSTAFKAVEGFATVAIARPLYDANQKFAGSLVLTLDTSVLPKLVLDKNAVPAGYELWAMETDGMIVCDQDKVEIGLNVFTDPMYENFESLKSLAKSIVASPQGEGEYSFKATGSQVEVAKKAVWDTINIHGREWRVVLVAS